MTDRLKGPGSRCVPFTMEVVGDSRIMLLAPHGLQAEMSGDASNCQMASGTP